MKLKLFRRIIRSGAIFLVALVGNIYAVQAQTQTLDDVYSNLKSLEGRIPLPTLSETVMVGTFNDIGIVRENPEERERGRPSSGLRRPAIYHKDQQVNANAVEVTLRFIREDNDIPFRVYVGGNSHSIASGGSRNYVDVSVGRTSSVDYRVTAGNTQFWGKISIVRPPIIGVGAFTVPAIPIAIVYDPPQDPDKKNKATYRRSESSGTTIGTSFMSESSSTVPVTPSQYVDVQTFKDTLQGIAAIATPILGAIVPPPISVAVRTVLDEFSKALGTVNANATIGTKVTTDYKQTITLGSAETYGTSHLGPGHGDRIVYLLNARIVWLIANGQIILCLLGADAKSADYIDYLQGVLNGQLSAAQMAKLPPKPVIEQMLALDPFVAQGPNAKLDKTRFVYKGSSDRGSGVGEEGDIKEFSHKVEVSDFTSSTFFQAKIEDYRTGWLSFLGIGVQQDETLSTRSEMTHLRGTTESVEDIYVVTFFVPL